MLERETVQLEVSGTKSGLRIIILKVNAERIQVLLKTSISTNSTGLRLNWEVEH